MAGDIAHAATMKRESESEGESEFESERDDGSVRIIFH